MVYKKDSFKNMRFNPLAEKPILETYPELKDYLKPEQLSSPYIDELLRYIFLTNDPNCILFVRERDLNRRKQIAADLSGLSKLDESLVIKAQNNEMVGAVSMVDITVMFLQVFVRNRLWAAIQARTFTYWECIHEMMTPLNGESEEGQLDSADRLDSARKKAILKDEMDKDLKQLTSYEIEFFGEDDLLLEKAVKIIRPEDYAMGGRN